MPTATEPPRSRTAHNPGAFFRQLRERGLSDAVAAEQVGHSYPTYNAEQLGDEIASARRALEQPPVEASDPEPEPDPEPDPLDPIAVDAGRRLGELRAQRARLSLGALSNPAGPEAQELASIEDEITRAEKQLERCALARAERERRAVEAVHEAERKVHEQLRRKASVLGPKLAVAAKAIDKLALELAQGIVAHRELDQQQRELLERAGDAQRAVNPWVSAYELAIRHALEQGGAGQVIQPAPGHGHRADFAPLCGGD